MASPEFRAGAKSSRHFSRSCKAVLSSNTHPKTSPAKARRKADTPRPQLKLLSQSDIPVP
jgi:hypothetical protein